MRISDWSSDVCSSDLLKLRLAGDLAAAPGWATTGRAAEVDALDAMPEAHVRALRETRLLADGKVLDAVAARLVASRRIDVSGAGVSGLGSQLLAYTLLGQGLTAQALHDHHHETLVAPGL